jgi:nicotinate-nucleotide adenylyltransferase
MSARTGILGGSFDPIHYGHLAIAEEARAVLRLDRVLFIPAARQPLKTAAHIASPEMRLEMACLACTGNGAFQVSPIEIERSGPSYTVATLEALRDALGGELFFILGADALADLPRWRAAPRIIELAGIVAIRRPGFALDAAVVARALPGLAARLTQIEGPMLDISSTALRQRVAAGRPIRYQTPDPVIRYIAEKGLYSSNTEITAM